MGPELAERKLRRSGRVDPKCDIVEGSYFSLVDCSESIPDYSVDLNLDQPVSINEWADLCLALAIFS